MEPRTEVAAPVDDLGRKAKAIINGTAPTQPMVPDRRVEDFLTRVAPTSRPRQDTIDWLTLQCHYGGKLTACFLTRQGYLVVLASEDDVARLLPQLTEDERRQIVFHHPPVPHFVPSSEWSPRDGQDRNNTAASAAGSDAPTAPLGSPPTNP